MVNNPTIRPLTPANRKIIERFVGLFQYYGRTLDGTMLASISSIATNMTTAQQKDLDFRIKQFLNYAATHPDANIRFIASEMHLWIHSNASYLTEPKARSRAGGFFYLSKKPNLPIDPSQPAPPDNGPILILCKILDTIMSSAQEAETGAAFVNTRKAIPMRQTLEELGHNQGPTPIQLDNKTAVGILTDTMVQRRSKPMDMRFYWLKCREIQEQIHIYWKKGTLNKADYPTKHHPTKHHIAVRPDYVLNMLSFAKMSRSQQQQAISSSMYNVLQHSARVC